ncbi:MULTISPECIES: cob(I)yrinic acid a,c-diamide adenosyltransferase [unclassified Aureispira]|uniref:cob(I)yrinic acid a,c-diamide adenosyltransferase n=1 Tax=unclassified Aureispira TaxID=2649989 RepID=UPI000696274E|nr:MULTISPECIES: cob(I)yrinic acid a,c-diamide adenosyltransferase [unclassified Aureispira]WMX12467.1 cob(I)yrinic acid a,c-diamide adenosyltransferase [Aureispira sp. CCB-E]
MAFKVYTKTGDKGSTALFGGARVPKNHIRIESYGTVDELNSYIGLIRDYLEDKALRDVLKEVQDRLFTLGAILATDPSKNNLKTPDLHDSDVTYLESEIDRMQETLPTLKYFVLPGGHPTVSFCHVARCVCRRAERMTVALNENEPILPVVMQYLNRLSDYLFVLGRYVGALLNAEEVCWIPRK